jgi:hypothetical protein
MELDEQPICNTNESPCIQVTETDDQALINEEVISFGGQNIQMPNVYEQ